MSTAPVCSVTGCAKQQVMSLEEAVYRLTGKTALMHDLHDRGFITPGKVADITIFDPETIASKPRELVHDLPDGGARVKRGGHRDRLCHRQWRGAVGKRGAYRRLPRPGHPRPAVPRRVSVSRRPTPSSMPGRTPGMPAGRRSQQEPVAGHCPGHFFSVVPASVDAQA